MELEKEQDAVVQDEEAMDEMAEVSLDEPEQQEPAGLVPEPTTSGDSGNTTPDGVESDAPSVPEKDESAQPDQEKDASPQPQQDAPQSEPAQAQAVEAIPTAKPADSPPTRPPSSIFGQHMRTQSSRTSISLSRSSMQGGPQLSAALIIPGLETIAESKEAKKNPALLQAAQKALDLCKGNEAYSQPRAILEPLRLGCETHSEKLVIPALDLLAKLVSHSFFFEPSAPEGQPPLADLIAHIITMSYTENSSPAVGLQVVKALLSLVLSPTLLIHQSSLLKAVRTVYNVYLLSSDTTNQMIAQGGLTQMVHHIFARIDRDAVRTRPATPRAPNQNGRTRTPVAEENASEESDPVAQVEKQETGKPTLTV